MANNARIFENEKVLRTDYVVQHGDLSDGAIEAICKTPEGFFEIGYFYGHDKPKNIIVASNQIGCPARCHFCELGSEEFIRDLTPSELENQVYLMLRIAEERVPESEEKEHKINWSKSGDPLFNKYFLDGLLALRHLGFSHKVSTIFPYSPAIKERFRKIADFAADYPHPVQVQISLISTSEEYRLKNAGIKVATFEEIRDSAEYWHSVNKHNRKINLSLILDNENPISVLDTKDIFPPELFRFRFRNYVPTENGRIHGLKQISEENLGRIAEEFRQNGYDVGFWATPTKMEQRFGLASNVTLRRYKQIVSGKF